jgi:hypothetical protein
MGAGLGESQQQRGQAGAGHFVILHNIHYAKLLMGLAIGTTVVAVLLILLSLE